MNPLTLRVCKILVLFFLLPFAALSQSEQKDCGTNRAMDKLFRAFPELQNKQSKIEADIYRFKTGPAAGRTSESVLTIPVVVHIIHNNGPENISDAQVQAAISHLNDAYANTGYYDPADGADAKINFCLARRDPNGNITSGITRTVSPLTYVDGSNDQSQDIAMKNLSRWDPTKYVNIWIVADITGSTVGYAYLPAAHGRSMDGLVIEAAYFGSSHSNDVVVIHEMGHYLGLLHTFDNGCANTDCNADGDKVCDTPPDQLLAYTACTSNVNSCNTDAASGFNSDQNDLKEDYMDYGNWTCMKVFTQGQVDRMRWHLLNVRASLLSSFVCADPCPNPVTAAFTVASTAVTAGTTLNFTNTSVNGAAYKWYINNALVSTAANLNQQFNQPGQFVVKLVVVSSTPLQCDSAVKSEIITVDCSSKASFTPNHNGVVLQGQSVTFTNTSTGATSYQWQVNNVITGTGANFTHTFGATGTTFIKLVADNGVCKDSTQVYYQVNTSVSQSNNTYQKFYAVTGQVVSGCRVEDAVTDVNGNLVVCGQKSGVAFVGSVTPAGTPRWSKRYDDGRQAIFRKIVRTSDGGYLLAGMKNYDCFDCYTTWLVKIDSVGTLQWTKHLTDFSVLSYWTTDLIQLSDGGFGVLFTHNQASLNFSDVVVVNLDQNGNIRWSKRINKTHEQAAGLFEEADGLLVSGHYRKTGNDFDGFLIKFDKNNGKYLWGKTIDIEGKDNRLQNLQKNGNNILLTGFNISNGQEKVVVQLDENGNNVNAVKITAPALRADTRAMAIHADGSYTLALGGAGNVGYAIHMLANGTLNAAKKYNHNTSITLNALVPHQQGILMAGHRGDNIVLIKTNSMLATPGCNDEDITPVITPFVPQVTSVDSTFFGQGYYTLYSEPTSHTTLPSTLTEYNVCNDFPIIATCDSATYRKFLTGATQQLTNGLVYAPNGNLVHVGSKGVAFLAEISPAGNVIIAKQYAGEGQFNKIIKTQDNGFVVTGPDGPRLIKLDAAYNVVWKKRFSGGINIEKLFESAEGDLYVCGRLSQGPLWNSYLIKLGADGTLAWMKRYESVGPLMLDIAEEGDNLIVTYSDATVAKLAKANGSILWRKYLTANGGGLPGINILRRGNYFYLWGLSHLIKTDLNLNVLAAKRFNMPGAEVSRFLVESNPYDQSFTLCFRQNSGSVIAPEDVFMMKVDSNFNILSSFRSTDPRKEAGIALMHINANQVYVAGTMIEWSGITLVKQDILFYRVDMQAAGNNCSFTGVNASMTTLSNFSSSVSFTASAWDHAMTEPVYNVSVAPSQFYESIECFMAPCTAPPPACDTVGCGQFTIAGPATICNAQDVVTYTVTRGSSCTLPVEWMVDNSMVTIISKNDAELKVKFLKSGSATIKAKMTSSCRIYDAEVTTAVFKSPPALNLGADVELCNSSVYTLKAPAGFASYNWQDGNADSVYTVYRPGIYHLAVTDHCGNVYRDTVNVTTAAVPSFELGNDIITKCNNDSVTLTAPAGFQKYTWAPAYASSSAAGAVIKVSPQRDTMYTVVAEVRRGCVVMDSVFVSVKTSRPIQLGRDTSFCQGGNVTLNAGAGFNTYSWSNGATTASINVNTKGKYWVNATDANGCSSRDTLEITAVHALPPIDLGKDTSFCDGQTVTLNATNGLRSYAWNTGATTPSINVSQPGIYWVEVTSAEQCKNADTMQVLNVYDIPAGFVSKDTFVCRSQSLVLNAAPGYKDYLWSTGSNASSVEITKASSLWLEVTDNNGCKARETINVREEICKQVLYFPNAFTPQVNGHNDIFKPTVYGKLNKYHLVIYNRYGQRIFESHNYSRGWDGKVLGVDQGTGNFVWVCTYQFADEPVKQLKGNLVLVR